MVDAEKEQECRSTQGMPLTGAELMEDFFRQLGDREDIDENVAQLIQSLFRAGNLAQETVLRGLANLRDQNA